MAMDKTFDAEKAEGRICAAGDAEGRVRSGGRRS